MHFPGVEYHIDCSCRIRRNLRLGNRWLRYCSRLGRTPGRRRSPHRRTGHGRIDHQAHRAWPRRLPIELKLLEPGINSSILRNMTL